MAYYNGVASYEGPENNDDGQRLEKNAVEHKGIGVTNHDDVDDTEDYDDEEVEQHHVDVGGGQDLADGEEYAGSTRTTTRSTARKTTAAQRSGSRRAATPTGTPRRMSPVRARTTSASTAMAAGQRREPPLGGRRRHVGSRCVVIVPLYARALGGGEVWKIRRPAGRKTRVVVSTVRDCVPQSEVRPLEPCGVPNPLAITASSGGGGCWSKGEGRRADVTVRPWFLLFSPGGRVCNDDLHDCLCLAQDDQTLKREHASTHALTHPLVQFSLTNGFGKKYSFLCGLFSHFHLETSQEG